MKKLKISLRWMDRINFTLTLIIVSCIVYFIGNTIPDNQPEIGSSLAFFAIMIFVPVAQIINWFMDFILTINKY
jgi:hypothetical protein